MKFLNKNNTFIFFAYIIFPFTFFEFFSQIIYFQELKEKAYMVERFMTNTEKRKLRIVGLHSPYMDRIDSYSTLYATNNNFNQKVRFRTDKYGTIIPSNVNPIKQNLDKYVLFCGGSTIENSVIKEGKRISDIFSEKTKISSINASKSGKAFKGCIGTIDYINQITLSHPQAIIIGTNINTYWKYAYKYKIIRSKYLRLIIPGLMQHYSKVSEYYKELYRKNNQTDLTIENNTNKLSGYEEALSKGCCYGPMVLNAHGRKEIKWLDNNIINKYRISLRNSIEEFENMIKVNNILKKSIYIYIEPNSFSIKNLNSKFDYRQYLYSYNGQKLDLQNSAAIANKYDDVYEQEFIKAGFKVIRTPLNLFNKYDFYDSAHFTELGSRKVANYLIKQIDLN